MVVKEIPSFLENLLESLSFKSNSPIKIYKMAIITSFHEINVHSLISWNDVMTACLNYSHKF